MCIEFYACSPDSCKSNCGRISSFDLTPTVADAGDKLTIDLVYSTPNDIGTGEVYFNVLGPDTAFGEPRQLEQHMLIADLTAKGNTPNGTALSMEVKTSGYVLPLPAGSYAGNVTV